MTNKTDIEELIDKYKDANEPGKAIYVCDASAREILCLTRCRDAGKLAKALQSQTKLLEETRVVLQFYADSENYLSSTTYGENSNLREPCNVVEDHGEKAQAFLKKLKEQGDE